MLPPSLGLKSDPSKKQHEASTALNLGRQNSSTIMEFLR
jgi:hypothetical protein